MSTKIFDVHTHVQFAAFKDDADFVIERALAAGVWIINVGTQRDTSRQAVNLAEKFPEGVYAAVGLHPIHTERSYHDPQELGIVQQSADYETIIVGDGSGMNGFTSRGEEFDYEYYKKLASYPKVVAIGECGLDYYHLESATREKQKNVFLRQIELARDVQKPLMIHCRNAFQDLINLLKSDFCRLGRMPGVVHFFSGTKDDARKLLGLGFSFSFGGVITFTRDYDEVVKFISLERILLETDAPYVAPVPYRGKRNEPMYIIEVAKRVAELKNTSLEEVLSLTFRNAAQIFGILARL